MKNERAGLRVIVLHGAHGGPDTNWFSWLHAALNAEGIEVLRPQFPTPEGQSLEAWLNVYDLTVKPLSLAPSILVGHSLGPHWRCDWLSEQSSHLMAYFWLQVHRRTRPFRV